MDEWGAQFRSNGPATPLKIMSIAFVVSGCIGMLQCWLEKEMPISPREMAAMVEGVLVKGVTAL